MLLKNLSYSTGTLNPLLGKTSADPSLLTTWAMFSGLGTFLMIWNAVKPKKINPIAELPLLQPPSLYKLNTRTCENQNKNYAAGQIFWPHYDQCQYDCQGPCVQPFLQTPSLVLRTQIIPSIHPSSMDLSCTDPGHSMYSPFLYGPKLFLATIILIWTLEIPNTHHSCIDTGNLELVFTLLPWTQTFPSIYNFCVDPGHS